jgi:hypothetical protein
MKGVLGHLVKGEAQKPGRKPPVLDQTVGAIPFGNMKGIQIQLFLGAIVEADYKGLLAFPDQIHPLY